MKKNNRHEILRIALRLLLAIVVGAAISFIFIYALFSDNNNIIELLFSEDMSAHAVLLVIITWVLGAFVGFLITALEFINILAEKNVELKEAKEKNKALRAVLSKIDKKYARSPASRLFSEINDMDFGDINTHESNIDEEEITALQEMLKAQKGDNSSK